LIGRCEDCGGRVFANTTPWSEQDLSVFPHEKLLAIIRDQRRRLETQSIRAAWQMTQIDELKSMVRSLQVLNAKMREEHASISQEKDYHCKQCGEVMSHEDTGRMKEFCSSACRSKYWRQRHHHERKKNAETFDT